MNRKMLTPILALGLILCLMAPGANAWEFSMDGTFTWLYEVRGQMGTNGFFGRYDQAEDDGNSGFAAGAYAPYNFYTGGYYAGTTDTRIATAPTGGRPYVIGQIVSGSDASWNTMYMLTNLQIRMNPAVRIRGSYYIGSWDTPYNYTSAGALVAPEYLNMEAHGVQRSFSPGYWRTLWLTAQLPWGEIAVGKRPSSWGMGLAFDGADNRSSESLALAAPFGPIRVQLSFYPSRQGYKLDDQSTQTLSYFNYRADKNNTRVFDMTVPNITYACGPISAGVYANWMFRHRGLEGRILNPTTRVNQSATNTAQDFAEWYGGAFVKYNNGRFFLNSEFQTLQSATKALSNNAAGANRPIPPVYTEFYGGALEAGVLAGPAKVSLIGAWFTGDDIRVGATVINGNQQFVYKTGRQYDTWSNTSVFRPYSYLMVYSYGLGQSFAKDTGNGYVSDASVYAGRLDYAVAANLNIFGSFMWAERFSKSGYTWGCLRPATDDVDGNDAINGQVMLRATRVNGGPGVSIPTIPDTALGWEIDGGFDWKLLEALTARCTFGYWVPGKWWNYATVDKNIPGWGNVAAGGGWGNNFYTRPDKTIDPIWGLEFKLEGTF